MKPEHHTPEEEVPVEATSETEEAEEEGELGVDLEMAHLQAHLQETGTSSYATAVTPKDTDRKNVQQKQN